MDPVALVGVSKAKKKFLDMRRKRSASTEAAEVTSDMPVELAHWCVAILLNIVNLIPISSLTVSRARHLAGGLSGKDWCPTKVVS